MFKKEEGITLVALVITIIVLLILAGVSISLVIGNNGVLTQASTSVVKNNVANVKEDLTMALAASETTYYTKWAQDSSVTRTSVYDAASTVEGSFVYELGRKNYTVTFGSGAKIVGNMTNFKVTLTNTNGESYEFTFDNVVDETTGAYTLNKSVTYTKGGHTYTVDV